MKQTKNPFRQLRVTLVRLSPGHEKRSVSGFKTGASCAIMEIKARLTFAQPFLSFKQCPSSFLPQCKEHTTPYHTTHAQLTHKVTEQQ